MTAIGSTLDYGWSQFKVNTNVLTHAGLQSSRSHRTQSPIQVLAEVDAISVDNNITLLLSIKVANYF